ncbi:MAG: hypothetical protein LW807_07020 [Proteobacteria bacterium]|jgi:hypothetical protein|nr:hypothetical protein [Pseudomonadota bacterium]
MGKYDQADYTKRAKKKYSATTLKETKKIIEITREQHDEIKTIAEQKNITMIQLLQEAINKYKTL